MLSIFTEFSRPRVEGSGENRQQPSVVHYVNTFALGLLCMRPAAQAEQVRTKPVLITVGCVVSLAEELLSVEEPA